MTPAIPISKHNWGLTERKTIERKQNKCHLQSRHRRRERGLLHQLTQEGRNHRVNDSHVNLINLALQHVVVFSHYHEDLGKCSLSSFKLVLDDFFFLQWHSYVDNILNFALLFRNILEIDKKKISHQN